MIFHQKDGALEVSSSPYLKHSFWMICMLRKRVTVSTILVLMCVFPYKNPTNNSETKYKHFLEWKNIMSMFIFFAN
jgi:hypothetical protein